MIDALRMIQAAAIVGDCLLALILVIILSALIARALRRNRPRIHDAPRPRPLPTPPTRKTRKRKNRKRNKPPSDRTARNG